MKGKALEKFEEWYFKTHCKTSIKFNKLLPHQKEEIFEWFYNSCDTIKNAFYVEFFDSVGIYITPTHNYIKETFGWVIKMNSGDYVGKGFSTRPEALSKAIEKAIEIFNNQSK